MQRVTTRLPRQQVEDIEQLVKAGRYPNRSEAIRDAVRDLLNEHRPLEPERQAITADGGEPQACEIVDEQGNELVQPPWFREYRGGDGG